jgi:hypothetical protein
MLKAGGVKELEKISNLIYCQVVYLTQEIQLIVSNDSLSIWGISKPTLKSYDFMIVSYLWCQMRAELDPKE